MSEEPSDQITALDESILAEQDADTLCRWCCELNSWEWPVDLPNPEPPDLSRRGRRGALRDWIGRHVGLYLINRYWNTRFHAGCSMNAAEHLDFWKSTFEGDAEARRRNDERVKRRYEERAKESGAIESQ